MKSFIEGGFTGRSEFGPGITFESLLKIEREIAPKKKQPVGLIVGPEAHGSLLRIVAEHESGMAFRGLPVVVDPEMIGMEVLAVNDLELFARMSAEISRKRAVREAEKAVAMTFTVRRDADGKPVDPYSIKLYADIDSMPSPEGVGQADKSNDAEDAVALSLFAATGKLPDSIKPQEGDALTLEKLVALKDRLNQPARDLRFSDEVTFEISPHDARKWAEFFAAKEEKPDPTVWGAGAHHGGARRNLAKEQRRSAKAAAYQARCYVAKTIKRERRKDRKQSNPNTK